MFPRAIQNVREARHMNNTSQRVFSSGLTDGSHTLRFDVERTPNEGWRIREQRDAEVVRQVFYGDWHRVELAIAASAEAWQLKQRGWRTFH
jgi:hypothetical protein